FINNKAQMKNNIECFLISFFMLLNILSGAQERDTHKTIILGDWKVLQIETLFQNEDGSPYRDKHIKEDTKTKDVDVALHFTKDSVQFILHDGRDTRMTACRYGEDYYEINSKDKGFQKYTYEIKGKKLVIEGSEKNMNVYGEVKVPKVIYRFTLKRK